MELGRANHSTAVLLPNAKVLSVGGEDGTAEIFSPPYLFKDGGGAADQPQVGFAPTDVAYGTSFSVVLSTGSPVPRNEIDKVALVRLGSVTHHIDMNQRYVPLEFSLTPGVLFSLTVEAPDNGTYAPPGYYMLFLISDDGAPSARAKYIRLYRGSSP